MLALRILTVFGSAIVLLIGCIPTDVVDERCDAMREIGNSEDKRGIVQDWINESLSDPLAFTSSGRENGPLSAGGHDVGLDWAKLGIPASSGVVELYGKSVDYRHVKAASVEAAIIGYGYGYKLIFKLDSESDIEQRLMDESKKPYGRIRMEALSPDVTLVCQRRV